MSSADDGDESWITWLLRQPGFEWLCEVEPAFIEDQFNLYGLRTTVAHYRDSLECILSSAPDEHDSDLIHVHARDLYGLIHARYIVTSKGLQSMLDKYERKEFGTCPRFLCHGIGVLPLGLSNDIGFHKVKLFCPRCEDIFEPPAMSAPPSRSALGGAAAQRASNGKRSAADMSFASNVMLPAAHDATTARASASSTRSHAGSPAKSTRSALHSRMAAATATTTSAAASLVALTGCHDLDGSFFGPTFAHMLLVMKPQLVPPKPQQTYVPRVYGFKVHNQRGRLPLTAGDARGVYEAALSFAHTTLSVGMDAGRAAASAAAHRRTTSDNADVSAAAAAAAASSAHGAVASDFSLTDPAKSTPKYVTRSARADAAEDATGHAIASRNGANASLLPLTTWYLPGHKPYDDDFDDDDDDDAPAGVSSRKKRRDR